jgi:two-component system nitrogen regulation sensor histidine kinase NtrY
MNNDTRAGKKDPKKRRTERYLIVALLIVASLLTYFGTKIFRLGLDVPLSNSVLILILINFNVVLLLLLLFITVRNLVKLLFQRKKNILGAKLRTKLVLAFVTLSLLPTIILFFVSAQFISSSIEYWFNLQIEQSLKNSLEVGQDYYNRAAEEVLSFGNNLSRVITYEGYMLLSRKEQLEKFIEEKRKEYQLASIRVFSRKLTPRSLSQDHRIDLSRFKLPSREALFTARDKGTDSQFIQSLPHGDLVGGLVPVFSRTESKAVVGVIGLAKFVPGKFVNRLQAISEGLQEYSQLKMMKRPIKMSNMIMLSIVTLLIIFSAVWFGFYLSQGITVPIQQLAEGTNRIASGDYNFYIDIEAKDEIGVLVNSFNRMTSDLKASKSQVERANRELIKSNVELEQRRLYMEIVLANVAAGVVSADTEGNILTMNKSAERMLNMQADEIVGKNYREVLSGKYLKVVEKFMQDRTLFRKGFLKKQVKISVDNEKKTFLVSLNVLRDDRRNYLGLVGVFEDLSEIEKGQRMAAWREVARRIAHEVKNPLTPIQLSAQRLKKKYGEQLRLRDGRVFEECTEMIIRQVEELKKLVDEFSNFARMPAAKPAPANIGEIVRESLSLYREAHQDVKILLNDAKTIPTFNLDREQMKRVLINLLDNAIAAVDGHGEVVVDLSYDDELEIARLEVADNGKGIPPDHKGRLFEPYFSTKKQGTGLGLAIVNTVITDHNGFVRVQDNDPKGTRFIIELPVKV